MRAFSTVSVLVTETEIGTSCSDCARLVAVMTMSSLLSLLSCGAADAALGLRVVAEAYGLSFVSLAVTRCDLVVPADLRDHPGVAALLEAVQSSVLRRELDALPGYDSGCTGRVIATPQ